MNKINERNLKYLKEQKGLKFKNQDERICTVDSVDLTVNDLLRTFYPNWLNDQIVNFYVNILKSREFNQAIKEFYRPNSLDFWIFSSYLCNSYKPSQNGYFLEPF